MHEARFNVLALLTIALVVALPLAAQDNTDILQGYSYPPLHRIVVANASPDAGPTGIFPGKIKVAYGFNKIARYGSGQVIAIVDAYDDPTRKRTWAPSAPSSNCPLAPPPMAVSRRSKQRVRPRTRPAGPTRSPSIPNGRTLSPRAPRSSWSKPRATATPTCTPQWT